MKISHVLAATAVALISSVGIAQAITTDLGQTFIGETGTITESTRGNIADVIEGILPNDAKVTITYSFANTFTPTALQDQGTYKFKSMGTRYMGSASSSSAIGFPTTSGSQGFTNPVGHPHHTTGVSSLVLASSNLTNTSGSAVVTNSSIGTAKFLAELTGKLKRGGEIIITYAITGLSSVPLPASAYMFGLGLAMFAGLGMRKKALNQA